MSWLAKIFKVIFGSSGEKNETPELTKNKIEAGIQAEVDVTPKETSPIATLKVSDTGFVEPQEVVFDLGFFKIVEQTAGGDRAVVAWGDVSKGEAVVRPVKAKIHYFYTINAEHFSVSGEASVMNAEDATVRVKLPRFEYPVAQIDTFGSAEEKSKLYYHALQYPVEVNIEVRNVEFLERALASRAHVIEVEPTVSLPQSITYRAYVSPEPTVRRVVTFEKKGFRKDTRPAEWNVPAVVEPIYPTVLERYIGEELSKSDKWQKVKDKEKRLEGVQSKKVLVFDVSKEQSTRVFVQCQPDGGEWTAVAYAEDLDRLVTCVSLADETKYVNIQVYVFPRDFQNSVGIRGIHAVVYQSVQLGEGYHYERLYGEYMGNGKSFGLRITTDWGDADDAPRLWSVNLSVLAFKPRHDLDVKFSGGMVYVTAKWAGGEVEQPASDVKITAHHIDRNHIAKVYAEGYTDSDGKLVIDPRLHGVEEGDIFIVRYQGLYDKTARLRGYYPPEESGGEYRYHYTADQGWVRVG